MSDFQPKDFISLEGAIDIHMHPHPCLFDRLTDDWGVAEGAMSESMRGIVIKCHHESTVSRAQTVTRTLGGIEVYGGIVLNFYVGGLNAGAAEAACKTGGKIVWMPTIDAENHAVAHGSRGRYDVQKGGLTGKKTSGDWSIWLPTAAWTRSTRRCSRRGGPFTGHQTATNTTSVPNTNGSCH